MDILLIVFLTLVNAVFAMSEMAVAASRRNRLLSLAEDQVPGARKALELVDKPTEFLSTVQVGITSIGLLNGIVGEAAFSGPLMADLQALGLSPAWASPLATALVVVGITFFTIIFGELVPKRIGQMFPETLARWLAPLMLSLAWLTKPFVRLLAGSTAWILRLLRLDNAAVHRMTSQDVSVSLTEAVGHGAIEAEEHQVVSNVFRLDDRPLTSFMTPRADVVWLDSQSTVEQALAEIREQPLHSWYLVAKGSMDHVLGVIALSTLIQHPQRHEPIADLIEPALYLPETLTGLDLLTKLKVEAEQHQNVKRHGLGRLACVVDEYGEVQGLVTPGDLLEAITGELTPSSHDTIHWATQREDGSWLLDGLMPLQEIKLRLALDDLPDEEGGHYNTLAGLMLYLMGRLPTEGHSVTWANWRFEVMDMDGRRIDKVLASQTGLS